MGAKNEEKRQLMYSLYESGESISDIARQLKMSRQNAWQIIKKIEMERHPEEYFKGKYKKFYKKSFDFERVVYPNIAKWMEKNNISIKGISDFGRLDSVARKRLSATLRGKLRHFYAEELMFLMGVTGLTAQEILYKGEGEIYGVYGKYKDE